MRSFPMWLSIIATLVGATVSRSEANAKAETAATPYPDFVSHLQSRIEDCEEPIGACLVQVVDQLDQYLDRVERAALDTVTNGSDSEYPARLKEHFASKFSAESKVWREVRETECGLVGDTVNGSGSGAATQDCRFLRTDQRIRELIDEYDLQNRFNHPSATDGGS